MCIPQAEVQALAHEQQVSDLETYAFSRAIRRQALADVMDAIEGHEAALDIVNAMLVRCEV